MALMKFLALLLLVHLATCSFDLSVIELQEVQITTNTTNARSGLSRLTTTTFWFSDVKVNWFNALALCSSRGLQLLTIRNPYEDNDVKDLLSNRGSFPVWSAANDLQEEEVFHWGTTGDYMSYSKWRNGFPAGAGFNGCVSVTNFAACGRSGVYGWDKIDCGTLLYALCQ